MPTWPPSLPQGFFLRATDQRQDAVARTPMDSGPATTRNRFTAVSRELSVPIVLTGAQRQTLDAFFETDLANGALSFDWKDPVTDAAKTFRFRAPPRFSLGAPGAPDERLWSGTLELEILP